ncbi:hypothetical protein AAFF_G00276490 [Aldrovandia affinis]|uniref:Uncharacterized protein n=1 Tax=Aldrovandia affinis TaxID=143900 RepID=A0AAD7RAD8_9TELE|nr:hypothetical protein AAFF_G00276490 [Aldrovandia affinis]
MGSSGKLGRFFFKALSPSLLATGARPGGGWRSRCFARNNGLWLLAARQRVLTGSPRLKGERAPGPLRNTARNRVGLLELAKPRAALWPNSQRRRRRQNPARLFMYL